jgi:hypothetical protein
VGEMKRYMVMGDVMIVRSYFYVIRSNNTALPDEFGALFSSVLRLPLYGPRRLRSLLRGLGAHSEPSHSSNP